MHNKKNIKTLARESVLRLLPYSSARDEFVSDGREMVFLDANENPFDDGLNRYPDPRQRKLRKLLADLKGTAEENILLGNGSDEVLDLVYRAFCEPGLDNVITLPPTYGMYKVLAGVNAVENREVLLQNNFQPNVGGILGAADQHSKLLFLCSPNNPTANGFGRSEVTRLLEEFPGLVVIDEAYIDFSAQESWLHDLEQWPNLMVIQTLSKAYGLAGIRLGIGYASPEIIKILNKIKPPYNINELTQKTACEAVSKQDQLQREIGQIIRERRKLEKELGSLPIVNEVFPSDANFLLVRMDNATERYKALLQKGIVVRNRSNQPLCNNTLRFTVGTPEENKKLIQVLKSLS